MPRQNAVDKAKMTAGMMVLVAEHFKALGEPARLGILNCLRAGEMTVTELIDATGMGQANVSKHLQLLYRADFVKRRKEGIFIYYALADKDVFALCDLMCGRVERSVANRQKGLADK
jgi:DNA-binding transcriptional ArsR family regulator